MISDQVNILFNKMQIIINVLITLIVCFKLINK